MPLGEVAATTSAFLGGKRLCNFPAIVIKFTGLYRNPSYGDQKGWEGVRIGP
jgi:hypothetical protein